MGSRISRKERAKRKRRKKQRIQFIAIFLVFVILVGGIIYLIPKFDESIKITPFGSSLFYKTKEIPTSEMTSGDLILVNNSYPYHFETGEQKYPIDSKRNSSYQVKNDEIALNEITIQQFNQLFSDFQKKTGLSNVSIISAYRDYDYQNSVFTERVEEEGYYEASLYVALPGYSEHHTGLAADLAVLDSEGNSNTFTGEGDYAYVSENAWRYGFILRYPENKTELTGIAYESWHYRYVGKPHAYVMKCYDMCLEEYIEYIKSFTYDNSCLDINIKGDQYKIYYVPASAEEITAVKVPRFHNYTISGNNIDGFIVTEKG